jgi:hypothetical protein
LVVVLIIIATIAGFVIPQVGMLGRSSDMAATAKTQSDIAANVQLFFVQQKRYPQGLDSLLESGGTAVYASDTTNADTQTHGLPYAGSESTRLQAQLSVGALTNAANAEYLRSFTRAGFDWVYDHDAAVINSNQSGTAFRGLVADANGTGNTAPASVPVAILGAGPVRTRLSPQGLKPNEQIVALGVGPNNTAISKTLVNAPIYPGCDGKYYGRYIVYFKVYASGERATLVGVSDSYGRTPDYSQQQFNESLPDGGRQG